MKQAQHAVRTDNQHNPILETPRTAVLVLSQGLLLQEVGLYSLFPEGLWARLEGLPGKHQYSLLYSEAK